MAKRQETGMDRLKKIALWQWGLIVIFAGVIAGMIPSLSSSPAGSAAARGEAMGRGVATALFIVVGLVLIVVGLVRRPKARRRR